MERRVLLLTVSILLNRVVPLPEQAKRSGQQTLESLSHCGLQILNSSPSSLKYLLDVDVCAVVVILQVHLEPRACPPGETKQEHRPKACRTQPAVDTINTASRKYSMQGLAGYTEGCGLNMLRWEVSPSQGMVHSGRVWSPLPYSAFISFCPVSTVIEEAGAPTRGVLPLLDFSTFILANPSKPLLFVNQPASEFCYQKAKTRRLTQESLQGRHYNGGPPSCESIDFV